MIELITLPPRELAYRRCYQENTNTYTYYQESTITADKLHKVLIIYGVEIDFKKDFFLNNTKQLKVFLCEDNRLYLVLSLTTGDLHKKLSISDSIDLLIKLAMIKMVCS